MLCSKFLRRKTIGELRIIPIWGSEISNFLYSSLLFRAFIYYFIVGHAKRAGIGNHLTNVFSMNE